MILLFSSSLGLEFLVGCYVHVPVRFYHRHVFILISTIVRFNTTPMFFPVHIPYHPSMVYLPTFTIFYPLITTFIGIYIYIPYIDDVRVSF